MTAVIVLFMLVLTATAQKDQLGEKKMITSGVAKQVAAAAEKEICRPQCGGAIAVVDDGGNLIYEETLDHTQSPSIELAIKKARTAALYRRPTQTFHDAVAKATNLSYQDGSFPNMTTAIGWGAARRRRRSHWWNRPKRKCRNWYGAVGRGPKGIREDHGSLNHVIGPKKLTRINT
jgi:uncharacterized protein GlcG (DUF336 family)